MTKTNIRTLVRHGDRELWFASGQDWSLPLYVHWEHDKENNLHFATIEQGVGFYKTQLLTITALFSAHDIGGKPDYWIIPRRSVEALLHKAPGVTPAYYYAWPSDTMPPLPLPVKVTKLQPEPSCGGPSEYNPTASFVNRLCREHNLPGSVVRIVLKAISMEAPKWMMESRMPLDLGFCHLMAVPYRPNWKEIVSFKMKKWKLLGMLKLPGKDRWQALEEAGVPEILCSPDNIGMARDSNRNLHYSLEAIPTKKFESEAYKVEEQRQACGGTNYVATYVSGIKQLYPWLLQALEIYLKKTNTPFARISESCEGGVLRFIPTRGSKIKIHGVGVKELPVDIVTPESNFSVPPGSANRVSREAPPLRQVPGVLPPTTDVRECEVSGEVGRREGSEQRREPEDETDRVPLRPDLQSGHPTINLLSEGPGA